MSFSLGLCNVMNNRLRRWMFGEHATKVMNSSQCIIPVDKQQQDLLLVILTLNTWFGTLIFGSF